MRQPRVLGDARRDRNGPIGAGRDDPVDRECEHEALDRGLVLGREDAAAIGVPEPRRARIAVDDGDPQPAGARGLEQPELRGARA